MLSREQKEAGFTLIELLVVMSVMALISSILVVTLGNVRSKARDARRVANLSQVSKAIELYNAYNGSYPDFSTVSDPVGNWYYMIQDMQARSILGSASGLEEGSIELIPVAYASYPDIGGIYEDPMMDDSVYGNYMYNYRSSVNPSSYRLRTKLENLNHPALVNGLSGPFLQNHESFGDTACDKSRGYYCVGSGRYDYTP